MRGIIGLFFFIFVFGMIRSYGQSIPSYPIPSYGVYVNGFTNFANENIQTDTCDNYRGKRDAFIHLRSASQENPECQGMVWVYTLDYSTILGPYIVLCDDTLVVEIDDRDWGVLVESEYRIIVDVWFE
jgi:hypothetical protein